MLPDENVWQHFIFDIFAKALESDDPNKNILSDSNTFFDTVSCRKGACIIRMIYDYMYNDEPIVGKCDSSFRSALLLYLGKFANKSAVPEDLWGMFEVLAGDQVIDEMINKLSGQAGYPVINVSAKRGEHTLKLILKQEKFSFKSLPSEDRPSKWIIPITIRLENEPDEVERVLKNDPVEIELNWTPNHWIKLNSGIKSYCRINYPPDLLGFLIPGIENKTLNAVDRFNIQSDLFALERARRVRTDNVLHVIMAYKMEDQYPV